MNKNKPFRIGCEIIPFADAILFETDEYLHIGYIDGKDFVDGASGLIYTPDEVLWWGRLRWCNNNI